MARDCVTFDGAWQETFDDESQAVEWAEAVSKTGRLVVVTRRRFRLHSFFTAFPQERREEARRAWTTRVGDFFPFLFGSADAQHHHGGDWGGFGGGGHGGIGGGHGGHGGHAG
jgi:hypothetical protein